MTDRREYHKEYYKKNREKRLLWARNHYKKNPEYLKNWNKNNVEKCRVNKRKSDYKRRENPINRINFAIRNGLWRCLKGQKDKSTNNFIEFV